METHFMIFVTIGNLVSVQFPLRRRSEGADLARPPASEKTYRPYTATAAAILWKVELETS